MNKKWDTIGFYDTKKNNKPLGSGNDQFVLKPNEAKEYFDILDYKMKLFEKSLEKIKNKNYYENISENMYENWMSVLKK